jgi:hypothetical protein
MGQNPIKRERLIDLLNPDRKWPLTLQSAVITICGEFMESDEHEEMFLDEAKSWYRDFGPRGKHKTRESILKVWPDIKSYFWPENENVQS